MNIGIVGLGLIGGSIAKAYRQQEHKVYAYDIDKPVLDIAIMSDVVHGVLDDDKLASCDILFIALYPNDAIQYLRDKAHLISSNCIVMDTCGIKRDICETGFSLAKQHGFTFVGGHPMAGSQYSGFKNSRETLFKDAYIILVPEYTDDIHLLHRIKTAIAPLKFKHTTISSADNHDKMIAFTSQMAHVVSNAYIKSPTAFEHKGFSAGSYKDLTRVAYLNEYMWSELFLQNSDNLLHEMDILIDNLVLYKKALEDKDRQQLIKLLADGKQSKLEVDG